MDYLRDTFELYKKINEEFTCTYGQFLRVTQANIDQYEEGKDGYVHQMAKDYLY